MNDLNEMIRQRNDLDRQIRAAQSEDEQYTAQMVELHRVALLEIGCRHGLSIRELGGPGHNTICAGDADGAAPEWLQVEFRHRAEDGHRRHLTIKTTGGIWAEFHSKLPPVQAFTGYLNGLIEYDRQCAAQDEED